MSRTLTLELPDELAAKAAAAAAGRRLEDAAVEWIARGLDESEVGTLSDAEILTLCDATLDDVRQTELSERLADHREGRLDVAGRARLDELMADYRRGLVRKAKAWREAVARGLRPPPSADGA